MSCQIWYPDTGFHDGLGWNGLYSEQDTLVHVDHVKAKEIELCSEFARQYNFKEI